MQVIAALLHENEKTFKKNKAAAAAVAHSVGNRLFRGVHGNLAELLEVLHQVEGGLAGTGTGGFVTLYDLRFGVLGELSGLRVDFFNKLFHGDRINY